MEVVDTHFHLFDLSGGQLAYPWPGPGERALYRDWLAEDYQQEGGAKHAVFVQTINDCPEEIDYVLKKSEEFPFIKGIVGGLDVTKPNLEALLDRYERAAGRCRLAGLRHILDFEAPDWLAREDVAAGLAVLARRGLTFDLLLRPPLLKYVPPLARKLPDLRMVVDHLAKPYIRAGRQDGWSQDLQAAAACPNVHCKISGLVTEADLEHWKAEDIEPYVEHALSVFGPERCMVGSDWPVLHLAAGASYTSVLELASRLTRRLSAADRTRVFSTNAAQFYGLTL